MGWHAKGPVDRLGGARAQLVRSEVLRRAANVKVCHDFAENFQESTAEVAVVTGKEIADRKGVLDDDS